MAKRHQQHPAKEAAGRNNPRKTTEIRTGTYKRPETYHQQAMEHEDPGKTAQVTPIPPSRDETLGITHKADSQAMEEEGEHRSGSDSNAHKHRKGSRMHAHQHQEPVSTETNVYNEELRPHNLAGTNYAKLSPNIVSYEQTANDIKELHTRLGDLTDDELKSIVIVSPGNRLEQGAHYVDLRHLEQGEFVATAEMVAGSENYYVPKKDVDYIVWNRLMQVDNTARLDEPNSTQE